MRDPTADIVSVVEPKCLAYAGGRFGLIITSGDQAGLAVAHQC